MRIGMVRRLCAVMVVVVMYTRVTNSMSAIAARSDILQAFKAVV
jgi:hypothetical protein